MIPIIKTPANLNFKKSIENSHTIMFKEKMKKKIKEKYCDIGTKIIIDDFKKKMSVEMQRF